MGNERNVALNMSRMGIIDVSVMHRMLHLTHLHLSIPSEPLGDLEVHLMLQALDSLHRKRLVEGHDHVHLMSPGRH